MLFRSRSIQSTWTDEEQVRSARQRLATLKYGQKEEIKKADFHFIIDDSATYTNWSDFRSKEAMETYRKVIQKEKDKVHFEKTLEMKREEYANSNADGKKKLEPSILDLEKRIPQLNEEIIILIIETRNLEIQKLKQ